MMDSTSNLKSGVFVTVGIVLLLLSIIFFSGNRSIFTTYNQYSVSLRSVQGLDIGSIVSVSGKTVGNVSGIEFSEDGSLIATIKVQKSIAPFLSDKSLASLRTQGALGDKYIYIEPGPMSEVSLQDGQAIPTDQQPDLIDMITEKAADLTAFTEVLKELNTLLYNLNSGNKSAKLMENLVEASHNISSLLREPNIRLSFNHLGSVLKKIDEGDGTLGQLVNDPTLHNKLIGLMGDTPRNRYLKPLLREAIKQNEQSN